MVPDAQTLPLGHSFGVVTRGGQKKFGGHSYIVWLYNEQRNPFGQKVPARQNVETGHGIAIELPPDMESGGQ